MRCSAALYPPGTVCQHIGDAGAYGLGDVRPDGVVVYNSARYLQAPRDLPKIPYDLIDLRRAAEEQITYDYTRAVTRRCPVARQAATDGAVGCSSGECRH
jgi:hypothetical protein